MSFLDYSFQGAGNGAGLSQSEFNAIRANNDAILATQGRSNVDGPQFDYVSPGGAAVSSFVNSATGGILGTAGNQPDGSNPTGVAALLKDLVVLAFIGGAIYLFVKLGGINQIKKLAS